MLAWGKYLELLNTNPLLFYSWKSGEKKKTITAAAACNDARLGENWAGGTRGTGGNLFPPPIFWTNLKQTMFHQMTLYYLFPLPPAPLHFQTFLRLYGENWASWRKNNAEFIGP